MSEQQAETVGSTWADLERELAAMSDSEAMERGYRRGYTDGFQYAVDIFTELMMLHHLSRADADGLLQRHRSKLAEWRNGDCTRRQEPPKVSLPPSVEGPNEG
jgi:hypothetical protein